MLPKLCRYFLIACLISTFSPHRFLNAQEQETPSLDARWCPDVRELVFSYLHTINEVSSLRLVNRAWQSSAENGLWYQVLLRRFPELMGFLVLRHQWPWLGAQWHAPDFIEGDSYGERLASAWRHDARPVVNARCSEKITLETGSTPMVSSVSPYGRFVAYAGFSYLRIVEPARPGKVLEVAFRDQITAIKYSPDGEMLGLLFANKNPAIIIAARSGKLLQSLPSSAQAAQLSFSLQGDQLLIGYNNGSVVLWDTKNGSLLKMYAYEDLKAPKPYKRLPMERCHQAELCNDGGLAFTEFGDARQNHTNSVCMWNTSKENKGEKNGEEVFYHGNSFGKLHGKFSPCARFLVVYAPNAGLGIGRIGFDFGYIRTLATNEVRELSAESHEYNADSRAEAMFFSTTGKFLVVITAYRKNLELWNLHTGKRISCLMMTDFVGKYYAHKGEVLNLHISADGTQVIIVTREGGIHRWVPQVEPESVLLRLNEVNKSGQIFDIAWISPCGTEVLMVDSTTVSVERWELTRKGDKKKCRCGCALM